MSQRLRVVCGHVVPQQEGHHPPTIITQIPCAGWLHDPVIEVPEGKDLSGQFVLITGGNSGVGYEAAKALSQKGAQVIITSRSEERASEKASSFGGVGMALDLSDFEDVRRFARSIGESFSEKPLNVLILNAGMSYGVRYAGPYLTPEGKDPLIASNYLGHWLLVHLLRPTLERSGTRIVVVSSAGHALVGREMVMPTFPLLEDGESLDFSVGMQWYGASKLQCLLFAYKLQREFSGASVTVATCTPGAVKTSIGAADREKGKGPLARVPLAQRASEGARPLVAASLVDAVPIGKMILPYWVWEGFNKILPPRALGYVNLFGFELLLQKKTWGHMRAHSTSVESQDVALQDALWRWTAVHLGLAL